MRAMTERKIDLHVLDADANRGYLPMTIPIARDREIGQVLSQVVAERGISNLARSLQNGRELVLRAFAERMASLAVRNGDLESLRLGLIALLLSSRGPDLRDSIAVVPLFYDAIARLGVDLHSFVATVQEAVGDLLCKAFLDFSKRSDFEMGLEIGGYSASSDADGFRYLRNW
jgi:hypothetical protein